MTYLSVSWINGGWGGVGGTNILDRDGLRTAILGISSDILQDLSTY